MAQAAELDQPPPAAPASGDEQRSFPVGWRRLGLETLVPATVALVYALVLYRVWDLRWEMPIYDDRSDIQVFGTAVKTMDEGGWFMSNPRLNFPFGMQFHDFPMGGESLQFALLKALNWFTPGYAQTMNVFYLAGFGFLAAVAFLVLRHLRLAFIWAAPLALAYTFLPYHFVHEQSHLTRSTYFSGALAVLLVLWVLSWRTRFLRDPERPWRGNLRGGRVAFAVVLAVVIGVTETMATAFAMTVLAGCAIVAAIRWHEAARLVVAGLAIVTVALSFLVVSSPSLNFSRVHGSNEIAGKRVIPEGELYSLKISRLILPQNDHRLRPWGKFGQRAQTGSVIPTESGQYLGLLGIAGFLGALVRLLGGGLARSGRRDLRPLYDRGVLADHAALITVIALLVGTVAGFGTVLATFGFAQVRTWGRIEVLLAFSSLLLAGLGLEWLARRARARLPRPEPVIAVAALAVTALALFDGIRPGRDYEALEARWVSDERFVREIERRMPDGSAIFQVQVQPFPEAGGLNHMADYDHFRGYLHAKQRKLYWSYGGVKGRPGADWQMRVRNHIGPIAALPALLGMGYDGLWVDSHAFEDLGEEFVEELEETIKTPALVSENGRLRFYDLEPYKRSLGKSDEELRAIAVEQLGIEPPPDELVGKPPADNGPTTQEEWNALWGGGGG